MLIFCLLQWKLACVLKSYAEWAEEHRSIHALFFLQIRRRKGHLPSTSLQLFYFNYVFQSHTCTNWSSIFRQCSRLSSRLSSSCLYAKMHLTRGEMRFQPIFLMITYKTDFQRINENLTSSKHRKIVYMKVKKRQQINVLVATNTIIMSLKT